MARGARARQGGGHPGAHLGQRPAARRTRRCALAYVGTHNYDIGVNLAKLAQEIKPKGGTICIQSGGAAAANHNERMQGIRDTLSGSRAARVARRPADRPERLDRGRRLPALHQRRLPALGAADGGHPRQVPEPRRLHADRRLPAVRARGLPAGRREVQGQDRRRDELALVVADTLPVQMDLLKEGLSLGQVGQRPFEMGYKTMYFLKDIKDGKKRPRIRPTPASTSARPRTPIPAPSPAADAGSCDGNSPGLARGAVVASGHPRGHRVGAARRRPLPSKQSEFVAETLGSARSKPETAVRLRAKSGDNRAKEAAALERLVKRRP